MDQHEVEEKARLLGISLDLFTQEALVRAVRTELLDLQEMTQEDGRGERRRVLTEVLGEIRDSTDAKAPSTELVTLSASSLAELLKAAVGTRAENPGPDQRMRAGVQAAATQARKDFRNSRTLPLAGFGAFVAFVWAQRESFGVDLSGVGETSFAAGAFFVLLAAVQLYLIAWIYQRSDEIRLRRLYLPETQAMALREVFQAPTFGVPDFRIAMSHQVSGRTSRLGWASGRMSIFRGAFSAVDLDGALHDATDLAIERFVKLGVIEPVESWSGLEYRATARFAAG